MKPVDYNKIRNNLNDKLFYYSHGRKKNTLETLDSAIDDLSNSANKGSQEVTADEATTYTRELGYCLRRKSIADLVEFTKNNAHILGEETVASFVQSSPKVQEMTMWKLIYSREDLKDMHKEAKENIERLGNSKTI